MEVDEVVRACLDELHDGDEIGAAREMALERRIELLGTPDVASGLVTWAVTGGDTDREHSVDLLKALLEQARIDEENRGRLGDRFLDERVRRLRRWCCSTASTRRRPMV